LGSVARVPQIVLNFRQRHCGNQSVITWGMSFVGNAVRIVTTLASVKDMVILAGHVIAGVLNMTLMIQILVFWKRSQEILDDSKKSK